MVIDFESRLSLDARIDNMLRRVTHPDGSVNEAAYAAEEERPLARLQRPSPIRAFVSNRNDSTAASTKQPKTTAWGSPLMDT